MILYEFEGKKLLASYGIKIPKSQLIDSIASLQNDILNIKSPLVLKAQVLSGKRKKAGGIIIVDRVQGLGDSLKQLFGKTINNEKVEKVLVEELVEYEGPEYYVSITYDTDTRGLVLIVSKTGGTGVEEKELQDAKSDLPKQLLDNLMNLFLEQDCLLLEINPLVQDKKGEWIALDAKIKLDDCALERHKDFQFSPRSVPGHTPTKNETLAKKIDEGDYRGTAGSTYFDLDGNIAILASGGGASLTAMDALIKYEGKPANYTEYSGNPPKEKVAKLTQIVLSKPNLHGLFVVGAVANFTDIYETLSGFLEGLRQPQAELKIKFTFPIVIRRGGPRDQEAFAMLKKVKEFDLHLYGEETSITESAKIMASLAQKYATTT